MAHYLHGILIILQQYTNISSNKKTEANINNNTKTNTSTWSILHNVHFSNYLHVFLREERVASCHKVCFIGSTASSQSQEQKVVIRHGDQSLKTNEIPLAASANFKK